MQGGRQQLHPNGFDQRSVRPRPYNRLSRTLSRPEAYEAATIPPPVGRHHIHVASQLKVGGQRSEVTRRGDGHRDESTTNSGRISNESGSNVKIG